MTGLLDQNDPGSAASARDPDNPNQEPDRDALVGDNAEASRSPGF